MKAPFDCYAIYVNGDLVSIVSREVGATVSYNLKEITKLFLESAEVSVLSPQCFEFSIGCEIPLTI